MIHIFFTGGDPDFLAFVITLLMMLLLAAGVKKSLIFNNVLNVINLAVWVFVMTAGLFYVNTDNWTKHKGFLAEGWSGVSVVSFLEPQSKYHSLFTLLFVASFHILLVI